MPRFALVCNAGHGRHHVKDRGYFEAPARISAIRSGIEETGLFEEVAAKAWPDKHILAVHDEGLVGYLKRACALAGEERPILPYMLPVRNRHRPPRDLALLAGWHALDTFTPLSAGAWAAAREAVDAALTAAQLVLEGRPLAYALVRPPGHHAERGLYGGFCYLSSTAIAAHHLSSAGRVAILDIDYHHGNGQQAIFYDRADVLTVSIHGDPSIAYPFIMGFADERGSGAGEGCNLNLPLPETITPGDYREALSQALERIAAHDPAHLVVALGFDTQKGDPTGTWPHVAADFERIGRMIGDTGLPMLVVQEGGYRLKSLGANARAFFEGIAAGGSKGARRPGRSAEVPRTVALSWRTTVAEPDIAAVRDLVAATGFFTEEEVAIAAELVEERLERGEASGYHFVVAEEKDRLAGYACFGPIAGTQSAFDLFWIAVDPRGQKKGLGKQVLARAEAQMRALGATRHYAETSSTDRYLPTRAFYLATGFREAARIPDFYRPGDGKVVYEKVL
jgi:acetoin utilization deacetylase AcuC-like enzyme/L-amino acid N-acyltransferase YncA